MAFLFVQEETCVAKSGVSTKRAAEHTRTRVSAVLMAMQGLPMLRRVRAKFALVNRRFDVCICGVLELHMPAQFSFSLAGVRAHLTDQRLFLVTEFVAV